MSGPTSDATDIIAGLDALLPEQERVLQFAATQAGTYQNSNSAIFSAFWQLLFFVLSVDFDMRVLVRTLIAHPESRVTAEKYLGLVLEECDDAIGIVINDLRKAFRAAGAGALDPAKDAFDEPRFEELAAEFRAGVREFREDAEFKKTLREIRNTVAGHLIGKDVGMLNAAAWIASRADSPRTIDGVMSSRIVYHSLALLQALLAFARGLQGIAKTS